MRLDEHFATQTLKTPWQEWTPEIAESVRRHFLGPWIHKAHCREMPLGKVLGFVRVLTTCGPENQRLREAVADYLNNKMRSTESPDRAQTSE
jgi:hypothetical protein